MCEHFRVTRESIHWGESRQADKVVIEPHLNVWDRLTIARKTQRYEKYPTKKIDFRPVSWGEIWGRMKTNYRRLYRKKNTVDSCQIKNSIEWGREAASQQLRRKNDFLAHQLEWLGCCTWSFEWVLSLSVVQFNLSFSIFPTFSLHLHQVCFVSECSWHSIKIKRKKKRIEGRKSENTFKAITPALDLLYRVVRAAVCIVHINVITTRASVNEW